MTTLIDTGEHEAIKRLTSRLVMGTDVIVGPGDDCTVVRPSSSSSVDWVLTSDPTIEGSHFTTDHDPGLVGRKAVGRALSDLAAMGAEPKWALIDLVAPGNIEVERLEKIYEGAGQIAADFGLSIAGGDLSEGKSLELHVFAVGSVPRGNALLRSGACPGDSIFVTGQLGGSALGKHLDFEPRIRAGEFIRDWATAAIDVSDGLATDLRHVLNASNAGARIDLAGVPVSAAAVSLEGNKHAIEHALRDGEDFELLFTVPEERTDEITCKWKEIIREPELSRIGVITDNPGELQGVLATGEVMGIEGWGFRHFE